MFPEKILRSNNLGSTGQSVSSGMCFYVSIYFPLMLVFQVKVGSFPRILCDSLPHPLLWLILSSFVWNLFGASLFGFYCSGENK